MYPIVLNQNGPRKLRFKTMNCRHNITNSIHYRDIELKKHITPFISMGKCILITLLNYLFFKEYYGPCIISELFNTVNSFVYRLNIYSLFITLKIPWNYRTREMGRDRHGMWPNRTREGKDSLGLVYMTDFVRKPWRLYPRSSFKVL